MTTHEDLESGVGVPALLDYHGAEVRYRRVGPGGTGPWSDLRALVRPSTPEDDVTVGFTQAPLQPVVVVTIRKADLPCVTPKLDQVCVDGLTYGVKQILPQDGAVWRLYCVG